MCVCVYQDARFHTSSAFTLVLLDKSRTSEAKRQTTTAAPQGAAEAFTGTWASGLERFVLRHDSMTVAR